LLTLHAIADQAGADGAAPADMKDAASIAFRARTRELLARTGSMSRIPTARLRVLPKYRTPAGGITARSISRYACVTGPAVDVSVNQVGERQPDSPRRQLNLLLLPWPLRISATDFQPVPRSVHERIIEPHGYFEFNPSEPFDASLADRLLTAASKHADRVDIMVLPESALRRDDLAPLEAVLSHHGVGMLVAGLRDDADEPGTFTSNWVHFGASLDGRWWHYRQDKHHRWSLDRSQIDQYHLNSVLDPRVRWWEALRLERRSLQLMERADRLTVASLVCEDLAHVDEVVDLLRDLGPTLIVTLLLDGPQLQSRWTARYASVLSDDPGSAVLTVSSYGMVRRTQRTDQPSAVVALWKDRARGVHEITLDADAQGILLTADSTPTIRRAADGRSPELNVTDLSIAKITQIRAADTAEATPAPQDSLARPTLPGSELSVLLSWSGALTEALVISPDRVDALLDNARAGAAWRAACNLPQPAGELGEALDALANTVETAASHHTDLASAALRSVLQHHSPCPS
jgi:hypothetical protein